MLMILKETFIQRVNLDWAKSEPISDATLRLASIELGDTDLDVRLDSVNGSNALKVINNDLGDSEVLSLKISNLSNLDKFGDSEDAESGGYYFLR